MAKLTTETELKGIRMAAITGDNEPPQKAQPIRVDKKVGRNDPCPCGSGKKYKKCCFGKA